MTDQHSLPPLPAPNGQGLNYTISDMLMYGQACAAHARKAALEHAVAICEAGAEQMLHTYKREGAGRCASRIKELLK